MLAKERGYRRLLIGGYLYFSVERTSKTEYCFMVCTKHFVRGLTAFVTC